MAGDSYLTIAAPAQAVGRERSSKFLSYAYPVGNEDDVKRHLDSLRKEYHDATHHCYAWRMGAEGEHTRANDDGEPSGTAGKPILGQILSAGLTNVLIVVVRYFGGTKLGVPGLISAYREAAADVIANCDIVERTVDSYYDVEFSYLSMNDVMRVVKSMQPDILSQRFDNVCRMRLSIRASQADEMYGRLSGIDGVKVEFTGQK